jgi:hypothetical protein
MDVIKRHAILTAVATVGGTSAVYWLEPTTGGGTVFIVTFCLILVNGIGGFFSLKSGAAKKVSSQPVTLTD